MSLHSEFGGFESRRRARIRTRLIRAVVFAAVVAAFSYWAYSLGYDHGEGASGDLRNRFVALSEEVGRLRAETDAAIAARVTADERAAAFQKRYLAEAPQGPAKDIMAVVNQRLAEGVAAERIAGVVGAVTNETRCEPEISSRRFLVDTPLTAQSNSVGFDNNAITVSGYGLSARDSSGNVEAWYDPREPITVTFTLLGGRTLSAEGKLPLHHSVVVDDAEYRFTLAEATRTGYVQVTAQKCAYP